jgi:hypothetical protein
MVFSPVIIGNHTVDIQMHDTYFVFGGKSWISNTFFLLIDILLLFSWLSHILLRKYDLISKIWRRFHIGLSVGLVIILPIAIVLLNRDMARGPSFESLSRLGILSSLVAESVVGFLLLQLIFWVSAAVLITRKRGVDKKFFKRRPRQGGAR